MSFREKLKEYFTTEFSFEELTDPARSMARVRRVWMFVYQTLQSLSRHQTMTMASALAYKTLMAIVPLLLIGVAVATALGSENGHSFSESFFTYIEEKIPDTPALKPLLDLLRGISSRATEIAGIGLILLFFTAYSLLDSVEWVLNRIWQVTAKRKLLNRAISYLAVVIIVPLLMSFSVYLNTRIERATEQMAISFDKTRQEAMSMLFDEKEKTDETAKEKEETANDAAPEQQTTTTPAIEITEKTAATTDQPVQDSSLAEKENQKNPVDSSPAPKKGAPVPSTAEKAAPPKTIPSADPLPEEKVKNPATPSSEADQVGMVVRGNTPHHSQSILSKIALGSVSVFSTCMALTLLFYFMPFTPVRIRPAIAGGLFSGVLIELMKYGYSLYAMHASTNLTRLYGSTLLAFPLTLLWLWLVWVFVLLGAEIAFNLQNYHDLAAHEDMERRGFHNRFYLATRIVILASEDFHHGEAPEYFIDRCAKYLSIPAYAIRTLVQQLTGSEILREVHDKKEAYVPALDLSVMTLYDIYKAIVSDRLEVAKEPDDSIRRELAELLGQTELQMSRTLSSLNMSGIIERTQFPAEEAPQTDES